MSHFAVAVISDGTKELSELLAPYQENNMCDCPKEYLAFVDETDDYRETYETSEREFVNMPDGRRISPYDDEFRVRDESRPFESYKFVVPEELERVHIPLKEIYPTFEDYMKGIDMEPDPETGKYGYWENQNRKWDWWMVGGRWRAQVHATNGECAPYPRFNLGGETMWEEAKDYPPEHFDSAKLGDMIWDRDEAASKRANDQWRAWVEGEEVDGVGDPWYKPTFYTKRYGDRETYALCKSTMWWRAVVTPDGKWHEVGEMGWFACTSESGEELIEWVKTFKERFIDPYPSECTLTVVDCHI